jgi:hypothetical protein
VASLAELINVLINLFTALVGYVIGRLWEHMRVRWRYRKARRFWRSAVDGRFQIVVSRFDVDGFREPTGVVGGGDAIAERLLADIFQDIGLDRPETVFVDEPTLDRSLNLIILGGPSTNRIAREALEYVQPRLNVVDPGPGMPMVVQDSANVDESSAGPTKAMREFVANPNSERMTDYGVIVRAHNPFDKTKALVVISGAYGYGTWAGVRLTQIPQFLQHCKALDNVQRRAIVSRLHWRARLGAAFLPSSRLSPETQWAEIECLFKVDVHDGRPQTPEILQVRPLARGQEVETSAPHNGSGRVQASDVPP